MPTARADTNAVVLDNKLYVIGGTKGAEPFAANEQYDPATHRWCTLAQVIQMPLREDGQAPIVGYSEGLLSRNGHPAAEMASGLKTAALAAGGAMAASTGGQAMRLRQSLWKASSGPP